MSLIDTSEILVPIAEIINVNTNEVVDVLCSGESIRKAYSTSKHDDDIEFAVRMIRTHKIYQTIKGNYEKRSRIETFVEKYMRYKISIGELDKNADFKIKEQFRKKAKELFKRNSLVDTDWSEEMLKTIG